MLYVSFPHYRPDPFSVKMISENISYTEFLDAELAKCETWGTSGENTRCLFKNQTAFAEAKTKGVGRNVIMKFLGANWTEHTVIAS